MPEELEECVSSVLEDNPDYSEERAYAICNEQKNVDGEIDLDDIDVKEDSVKFKAKTSGSMQVLFKDDDGMVIWGPASVEVVDKERDKITAEALQDALPQLLRRKRLSHEHSDQLVGDILESYEASEEKAIEIDGHSYKRSEFPTAVLDPEEGDDVPEKGLYVAGKIYNDTNQAREVREKIENGEIDSYSISGEAIQSSTQVKDGELVDNIKEMDLSAVTLCEEGMNPGAKFAVLSKSGLDTETLYDTAKTAISKTMGSEEESEDSPDNASEAAIDKEELAEEFKSAANEVLSEKDFATTEDVENMIDEKMEEKGHYEDEMDDEDEEEKAPNSIEEKLDAVLQQLKEDDVDPDEIEDPDNDDEEEVDLNPEEDDEMPMEDEEMDDEEKGDALTLDTLKSALPEDLYRAVSEHLTEEKELDEVPADEEEKEDTESEEEDVEKSASDFDSYVEANVGPVGPQAREEVKKSYDEDETDEELQEGEGPGTLDDFYKSVGEEI